MSTPLEANRPASPNSTAWHIRYRGDDEDTRQAPSAPPGQPRDRSGQRQVLPELRRMRSHPSNAARQLSLTSGILACRVEQSLSSLRVERHAARRSHRPRPRPIGQHRICWAARRSFCAARVVRRQHGAVVPRRGTPAARLSARARHHRRTPFQPPSSALRHHAPDHPARRTRSHTHRLQGP